MADTPDNRGRLRRLWDWFWSPSAVLSVGFTLIAGFLAGIIFWGGFHWSLEATNSEEFCVSCHTMETNLGEYRETIHYNNHSGVRAVCSDCHVPQEFLPKMVRKVEAAREVWGSITGIIDTREKFEEHRLDRKSVLLVRADDREARQAPQCHNGKQREHADGPCHQLVEPRRTDVEAQLVVDGVADRLSQTIRPPSTCFAGATGPRFSSRPEKTMSTSRSDVPPG